MILGQITLVSNIKNQEYETLNTYDSVSSTPPPFFLPTSESQEAVCDNFRLL